MKHQQSGFTLVEIAIVLVIVGLLLGGVLKGQELIASAKVKNLIADFNGISVMVYGYQDKYRGFPGDQNVNQLKANFGTTDGSPTGTAKASEATPTTGLNNGRLDGKWDAKGGTAETEVFWQHVRLANLASGPTEMSNASYYPTNADGGRIGIESGLTDTGLPAPPIAGMTGAFFICSANIQGRYAKQMDTTMDDGNSATGSVRVIKTTDSHGASAVATPSIEDGALYIVCKAF